MAIDLAKKIDADIVMASDPDADRVGMACKNDKGEWVLINGNQTCLLFLYYIIKNRIAMGKMKDNDFIVKTIVTTELIKAVADKNKIEMRDCYTGFKWIAREIRLSEGKQQYIGGGEESYGSWPKTSFVIKMLFLLVRCWLKSVLGPKTGARLCSMF